MNAVDGDIIKRSLEIQKILLGDYSSCGKKIGHVLCPRNFGATLLEEYAVSEDLYKELILLRSELPEILKVRKSTNTLSCSPGTLSFSPGITSLECANTKLLVIPDEFGDPSPFLEVMKKGKPATFGDIKKQETRIDSSVRVATEFTEFTWSNEETGEVIDPMSFPSIRKKVQKIFPHAMLIPYKLNMYAEGGMFAEHVDHPIDPQNTIGTLVIQFPIAFSGGDFLLRFGSEFRTSYQPHFQAIIFPTTAPHRIEKVSQGCRVSITYSISMTTEKALMERKPAANPLPLTKRQYVCELLKKFPGEKIGFLLTGEYTLEALQTHGADCLVDIDDRMCYSFLSDQMGLDIQLVSVASSFWMEKAGEANNYDEGDCTTDVFQISLQKWLNVFYGTEEGGHKNGESEFLPENDIPFVWFHPNTGRAVRQEDIGEVFHGNDTEPGEIRTIYFHAAIIVNSKECQTNRQKSARKVSHPSDPPLKRQKVSHQPQE